MKVALSFPGCHARGGVERVMLQSAKHLARRGHEVTVFAHDFDPSLISKGIDCKPIDIRARPSFISGLSYYLNASNTIDGREFDIVNTHGCVCPLDGVHRVHSVHRAWLDYSRKHRRFFSASRIKQLINPVHPLLLRLEYEHFARRRYKKVIALTDQVRGDLGRFYGVPREDVIVVPNGFSTHEFNLERRWNLREEARAKLGIRDKQFALLFVANELERKGYPVIIEAIKRLRKEDIVLVAAGGYDRRAAMRLARRAGVEDRIIFRGPASDVGWLHAAADLFVLPTQYEAFCLAILEALGSGLPVVTSNVPGARDAIQPDVNGLLMDDPFDPVELSAAIYSYLRQPGLESLSRKISLSAAPYDWTIVMGQYEEALLRCI